MSYSKKIRLLRLENGLTQTQLANKAGVSLRTIQRYETATCKPDIITTGKLADALNVSADELIGNLQKRKTASQKQQEALNHAVAIAELIKTTNISDDLYQEIISTISNARNTK